MGLVLAVTWHPRGELMRFHRMLPELKAVYSEIVIVIPPHRLLEEAGLEEAKSLSGRANLFIRPAEEWSFGRSLALETALLTNGEFIHYADLDRLVRWVETRPDEWRETCKVIKESECVIMGRTPSAYQTHPNALIQTEAISNRVVSYFLGQSMDVSAGSKGFSRKAAEYIVANTAPISAMGTDAQWAITLYRAGFPINYIEVDGLDWESADRYMDRAVTAEDQRQAAMQYDEKPENWARRVDIAQEIVNAAFNLSYIGR
jgi:hypothetical protein